MTVPTQASEPGPAQSFDEGMDRTPPQDLDAERAVLGGMMLSKDAIADVAAILQPRDFYRPAHETVFRAVLALYVAGEPADPITVSGHLKVNGDLDRVGGAPMLHALVNAVPTAANAEYYAEIVRDQAVRRRLASAGLRIAGLGYAGHGEVAELVAAAQTDLAGVEDARKEEQVVRVGDSFTDTIALVENLNSRSPQELHGVPTGFKDFDALTHGLQPGQLVIVAGRPGMGKSTWGLDVARHAAIKAGVPTVFFSLEMGRDEVTMRLMAAEARVPLHRLRGGGMTEEDWARLAKVAPSIQDAPLAIDDSTALTALDIRAKARREQQRRGLGLVVVDYLQLMQNGGRRAESRQAEVSEISRNLKLLAKELEVPVIALSQLNRGPEQRTDKRPMISDLRESGSLEQDADLVILIHRDDAYDKESPRAGEADLIVAKHRNGPTATITLLFAGYLSMFRDMNTTA